MNKDRLLDLKNVLQDKYEKKAMNEK